MLSDLRDLLLLGMDLAREQHLGQLAAFVAIGLSAAVACFFLCSKFMRLWNRQIQPTAVHYFSCALAALVTVGLSVVLAGVVHLGEVAQIRVAKWSANFVRVDSAESRRLWHAEGLALKAAGYPQPEAFPQVHSYSAGTEAIKLGARTIAIEALTIFAEENALLHRLLGATTDKAVNAVVEEAQTFFARNPGQMLDFGKPLDVLRREMELDLARSIPPFQHRAILVAILVILVMQALPILLAGLLAYRHITVHPRKAYSAANGSRRTASLQKGSRYRS